MQKRLNTANLDGQHKVAEVNTKIKASRLARPPKLQSEYLRCSAAHSTLSVPAAGNFHSSMNRCCLKLFGDLRKVRVGFVAMVNYAAHVRKWIDTRRPTVIEGMNSDVQ